jgi:hypothetical protein
MSQGCYIKEIKMTFYDTSNDFVKVHQHITVILTIGNSVLVKWKKNKQTKQKLKKNRTCSTVSNEREGQFKVYFDITKAY